MTRPLPNDGCTGHWTKEHPKESEYINICRIRRWFVFLQWNHVYLLICDKKWLLSPEAVELSCTILPPGHTVSHHSRKFTQQTLWVWDTWSLKSGTASAHYLCRENSFIQTEFCSNYHDRNGFMRLLKS